MQNNEKKEIYIVDKTEKYEADLDKALEVVGLGRSNLKYSLVLSLALIAMVLEQIGYSVVLPAAACDLQMSDHTRGLVGSIPYIGMFLTSYPWGYLADTRGRKNTLIYSSVSAGIFSAISALMPDFTSFAVCKFLASLCLSCSGAVPYTLIDEILPAEYRDVMIFIMNGLQIFGALLVALLAWAILPANFSINVGAYFFRPWRLLTIVYATPFIITATLICFFPESPKYLVSQGKCDEALIVLGNMYAANKGKHFKEFPINRLIASPIIKDRKSFLSSLKEQTAPFLKWFYLKWMLLIGFLCFGAFSLLNGFCIWVPDIINRVLRDGGQGKTTCQVISDRFNQTSVDVATCNDNINETTLLINSVGQMGCAVIILTVSAAVKLIGKRNALIMSFWLIGTFCLLLNFITNDVIIAVLLLSPPILVIVIGAASAYVVEIVPTHLRGVALTVTNNMIGTVGSIAGNNIAGLMINDACESMFYLFAALLFLCGGLSLLLPNSKAPQNETS